MASGRSCTIGLLVPAGWSPGRIAALQLAAERLNHQVVAMSDSPPAEPDFVLASAALGKPPRATPVFALIDELGGALWADEQCFTRLVGYDGYLTISEAVPGWLHRLGPKDGEAPIIERFAMTPARQFVACQLERLVALGALRVCYQPRSADEQSSALVKAISARSRLRLQPLYDEAQLRPAVTPTNTLPAEFAASGVGLLLAAGDAGLMEADALYRLSEIVSVGAIAICPDLAWIRRHFADTVRYYPVGRPEIAAVAIERAVAEIEADPHQASAQARQAKEIFEQSFAAEVMLGGAVCAFQAWQARVASGCRTMINTDQDATSKVFARLPARILPRVAEAVAELAPLQPVPHWRFGGFAESPELAAHVRYGLWLQATRHREVRPITMRWHAGTRLALHLDNDLSQTLFSGGCFEPNEFALLDRVLRRGMVFLDGGANEGVYTIFAAARVGAQGRVIAVEPSVRELVRLRANIKLNRLENVEVVDDALADRMGTAALMIAEPRHAGQNTLGAFTYDIEASGRQPVATTTLDALMEKFAPGRLDVMKLDLEGAELRALSAAVRVLAEMKPLILAEASDTALAHQGGSVAELFALLEAAAYVVLTIDDDTGEPVPLHASNQPISNTIVAVHRTRDWGLIPP